LSGLVQQVWFPCAHSPMCICWYKDLLSSAILDRLHIWCHSCKSRGGWPWYTSWSNYWFWHM